MIRKKIDCVHLSLEMVNHLAIAAAKLANAPAFLIMCLGGEEHKPLLSLSVPPRAASFSMWLGGGCRPKKQLYCSTAAFLPSLWIDKDQQVAVWFWKPLIQSKPKGKPIFSLCKTYRVVWKVIVLYSNTVVVQQAQGFPVPISRFERLRTNEYCRNVSTYLIF